MQKRSSEQDLIIIKAHTVPIEKRKRITVTFSWTLWPTQS